MWPNVWGGQRLIIYKPSCWRNVIRLFSPPPPLSLSKEERQITPHAQLKIKAEIRPNSDLSRRCVSDSSATTKIFSLLLWFEPAVSNCRGKPEGWVWNKKRPMWLACEQVEWPNLHKIFQIFLFSPEFIFKSLLSAFFKVTFSFLDYVL